MSAITSGRRAPRVTARVSTSISSIVTGTVELVAEHDHRRGVADEDQVDAGGVGEAAAGRVVGGDHHDLLAARFISASSGSGSLPGRACSGRASGTRGHASSFQGDVVDQAGGADADRGGEDGRVEVGATST